MSTNRILVVGAGAKAAAIAAKCKSLKETGYDVPEIYVIERHGIAANWDGTNGYTDGIHRLGTPPEKDVGFPYNLDFFSTKAIRYAFSHFSWQAFCIEDQRNYGEWIDRGKLHPEHNTWAEYLKWVIHRSNCTLFTSSEIDSIEIVDDHWLVKFSSNGRNQKKKFSSIVFTGPGPAKSFGKTFPSHEKILDGQSFWQHQHRLNSAIANGPPICVIGGGETAASIVCSIIEFIRNKEIPIIVITRSGTIFSRGESYYENRIFTDPERWHSLSLDVRREVIRRGDRGVFSVDAMQQISLSDRIDHINGEIDEVKIDQNENLIDLSLVNGISFQCQMLISSVGFDNYWYRELFTGDINKLLSDRECTDLLEESIRADMSVDFSKIEKYSFGKHTPKLQLPMSASLAQGPGFPNLSCLGTLSDAILQQHCSKR